jgi:hypothetical protein
LVEFRLIRYSVPDDIADKLHDGRPEEISEARVFYAKRHKEINIRQSFKDILSDRSTNYYEVFGENYDVIKTRIDTGRGLKTLTFGKNNKYMESMPLSPDAPLDGGFPSYKYILSEAKDYLRHIKRSGGT